MSQLPHDDAVSHLLKALPLYAPSAAFARKTVAAFEAAWQRRRAREVARALTASALLSVAAVTALLYVLPITALNIAGHTLAQFAQKLRLLTHLAHGLTRMSFDMSIPLLVAVVIVCLSTTLLLERSVRLGRRTI